MKQMEEWTSKAPNTATETLHRRRMEMEDIQIDKADNNGLIWL